MTKSDILIIIAILVIIFFNDIKKVFETELKKRNPENDNTVFNALYSESGHELMKSEPFKKFASSSEFDTLTSKLSESQVDNLCKIM